MNLKEKLLSWDEKDTTYLVAIYQDSIDQHLDNLLELAKDESPLIQNGSTWLIKHHVDKKN